MRSHDTGGYFTLHTENGKHSMDANGIGGFLLIYYRRMDMERAYMGC
jgi:hypothetical protein